METTTATYNVNLTFRFENSNQFQLLRRTVNKMSQDTQFLQLPTTQPFYRNLATTLTLFALGNRSWWGYEGPGKLMTFHRKIVTSFAPVCIVSQIIYLIIYYKTLPFSAIRKIFIILPMSSIANVCLRSAQMESFEKIMKIFMNKVHLHNYCDGDDFTKEKYIKAEHYTRLTGYFLLFFLMADWALWYIIPLWHLSLNAEGVKNQTVVLLTAPRLWMPFDYRYNILNWSIIHALNAYLGFAACSIIITYNIISFVFVFNIIGHIQILKQRFRTEFTNPKNDTETKKTLISIIKQHSFITEVFKDTQTAFSYNVTANYCHNLLCDSLLMYEMMFGEKKETLMCGLMFLVFMGGLILMSLVLEEIRRESDDMADVIYNIPWEDMSISNQKTFMMMLARAQPPMEFISAGGLRAGVRPAISIIKSTFSYYVMLKSSIKDDK